MVEFMLPANSRPTKGKSHPAAPGKDAMPTKLQDVNTVVEVLESLFEE